MKGRSLPKGTQRLIATAPANKGSVSWTWPLPEIVNEYATIGSDRGRAVVIYGLVVGAVNDVGQSKFTIAGTSEWCVSEDLPPGCYVP